MIFLSQRPRRFLGVTWQGVFQKRRHRVAEDYGELIAGEIITIPNLIEAVLRGRRSDRLFQLINREARSTRRPASSNRSSRSRSAPAGYRK